MVCSLRKIAAMLIWQLVTVCMCVLLVPHLPLHLTLRSNEIDNMILQPKCVHCSTLSSSPVHSKMNSQAGPLPCPND